MIILENHSTLDWIARLSKDFIPKPEDVLWKEYTWIIWNILNFPRTWWIRRWIDSNIAEKVSVHCGKVAIATKLLLWTNQLLVPQEKHKRLIIAWWTHDLCEWACPDFTPEDIKSGKLTLEEKEKAEIESLKRFWEIYWDNLPLDLYNRIKSDVDFSIIHELDKLDAWVMAINYHSFWYNTDDFFDYTRKKLNNHLLKNAFEWLLKMEFPEIDFFWQYCVFLYFEWDLEKIRDYLKEEV